jgi:hypothetical protein
VRPAEGKNERVDLRRDALNRAMMEGAPKRSGKLMRAEVPTRVNRSGAIRGTAFHMGASRRSVGGRSTRFSSKTQGRRGDKETYFRSYGRSKALESEAQERWELKEASKVLARLTPSRG